MKDRTRLLDLLTNESKTQRKAQKRKKKRITKAIKRPKHIWTEEEDRKLVHLIQCHGPTQWSLISLKMKGRQGKQCRERWYNHLNPNIMKNSWTAEEELRLFLLFKLYGSKWSVFSFLLNGRTDNSIKNHWNSHMQKKMLNLEIYTKRMIEHEKVDQLSPINEDLVGRIKRLEFDNKSCRKGRTRDYFGFFKSKNLLKYIPFNEQMKIDQKQSFQTDSFQNLDENEMKVTNNTLKHLKIKLPTSNKLNKEVVNTKTDIFGTKSSNSAIKLKRKESQFETSENEFKKNFEVKETQKISPFFSVDFFIDKPVSIEKSPRIDQECHSIYSLSNHKNSLVDLEWVNTPSKNLFTLSNTQFLNSISSIKSPNCLSHLKVCDFSKSINED